MKRSLTLAVFVGIGGVLLHLGALLVVDVAFFAQKTPPEATVPISNMAFLPVQSNQGPGENRLLNDSAPLFMPTRWNPSADLSEVASLREATEVFERYGARLNLPQTLPDMARFSFNQAGGPLDLPLPAGSSFILSPLDRQIAEMADVPSQPPLVLAVNLNATPYPSISESYLPERLLSAAPESLWEPFQCLLDLSGGSPAGLPLLEMSSGNATWDEALRQYVHSLQYYRILKNGYYRITIFPR